MYCLILVKLIVVWVATTKAGKLEIKALDNKGRFQRDAVNYTTINTFKGLEADIVFIVDADKIPLEQKTREALYRSFSC